MAIDDLNNCITGTMIYDAALLTEEIIKRKLDEKLSLRDRGSGKKIPLSEQIDELIKAFNYILAKGGSDHFKQIFCFSSHYLKNLETILSVYQEKRQALLEEPSGSSLNIQQISLTPQEGKIIVVDKLFRKKDIINNAHFQSLSLVEKLDVLEEAFQAIKNNRLAILKPIRLLFFKDNSNRTYTDQQLANIGVLKTLYVETIKDTLKNGKAHEAIVSEAMVKHKLIDFNRTRYAIFIKEQTGTKEAILKLLGVSQKKISPRL